MSKLREQFLKENKLQESKGLKLTGDLSLLKDDQLKAIKKYIKSGTVNITFKNGNLLITHTDGIKEAKIKVDTSGKITIGKRVFRKFKDAVERLGNIKPKIVK